MTAKQEWLIRELTRAITKAITYSADVSIVINAIKAAEMEIGNIEITLFVGTPEEVAAQTDADFLHNLRIVPNLEVIQE